MNLQEKLGILGGMGPQPTLTFYQFVLDRTAALLHAREKQWPAVVIR